MKASDITDEAFLGAVVEAIVVRSRVEETTYLWATRWDVAAVLAGHPEHVGAGPFDYPDMPWKIVVAKAHRLIQRGLLNGCGCGCRGEFSITPTAAKVAEAALERHLAEHGCGTDDVHDPRYVGGMAECPDAMAIYDQIPSERRRVMFG